MFALAKINNFLIKSQLKQSVRKLATPADTKFSLRNSSNGFNGSLYIPCQKSDRFEPLINPTLNYKCPSLKNFHLPLTDIKITDIMKRQIMNLPEINKNKLIDDPLLSKNEFFTYSRKIVLKKSRFLYSSKDFQIEKNFPENSQKNIPMSCNKSQMSEIAWRKRKMNKHKRKKYLKKMFYVMKRRRQAKEKRYNNILALYKSIHQKKVEAFDPVKFINRELEKAKFFAYSCDEVYDKTREIVKSIPTFDEKYSRVFVNRKIPVHLRPENLKLKD